jgi:hypothetical protein
VEVSGISPGNSTGDCDDADAEPVAPAPPLADPADVADPADAPDCDADEGDDIDDRDDVDDREDVDDSEGADDREDVDDRAGTPRSSDPAVVPLLLAWPVGCNTVSPRTAVIPRNITAMMKMNVIALSPRRTTKPRSGAQCQRTPDPRKTKMKFRKGPGNRQDGAASISIARRGAHQARRANHRLTCPARFAKIFSFTFDPNQMHIPRHPGPTQRGVSRSSRT